MRIWVDADACPGEIKNILFRVAQRRQILVTLVANQALRTPASPWIETILVPGGMNVADRRIVELVTEGELVITADIPLAAEVVGKGVKHLIRAASCTRTPMSVSGWRYATSSIKCAARVK